MRCSLGPFNDLRFAPIGSDITDIKNLSKELIQYITSHGPCYQLRKFVLNTVSENDTNGFIRSIQHTF